MGKILWKTQPGSSFLHRELIKKNINKWLITLNNKDNDNCTETPYLHVSRCNMLCCSQTGRLLLAVLNDFCHLTQHPPSPARQNSFFFSSWVQIKTKSYYFFSSPQIFRLLPPSTLSRSHHLGCRHTDRLSSDLHSWAWSRAPRRQSRWSTSRRRRWPCWWLGEESGSPLACRETQKEENAVTFPGKKRQKSGRHGKRASEHPAESRRESRPFGGHTKGQEAAAAEEQEVGRNTTQEKCNNWRHNITDRTFKTVSFSSNSNLRKLPCFFQFGGVENDEVHLRLGLRDQRDLRLFCLPRKTERKKNRRFEWGRKRFDCRAFK